MDGSDASLNEMPPHHHHFYTDEEQLASLAVGWHHQLQHVSWLSLLLFIYRCLRLCLRFYRCDKHDTHYALSSDVVLRQ